MTHRKLLSTKHVTSRVYESYFCTRFCTVRPCTVLPLLLRRCSVPFFKMTLSVFLRKDAFQLSMKHMIETYIIKFPLYTDGVHRRRLRLKTKLYSGIEVVIVLEKEPYSDISYYDCDDEPWKHVTHIEFLKKMDDCESYMLFYNKYGAFYVHSQREKELFESELFAKMFIEETWTPILDYEDEVSMENDRQDVLDAKTPHKTTNKRKRDDEDEGENQTCKVRKHSYSEYVKLETHVLLREIGGLYENYKQDTIFDLVCLSKSTMNLNLAGTLNDSRFEPDFFEGLLPSKTHISCKRLFFRYLCAIVIELEFIAEDEFKVKEERIVFYLNQFESEDGLSQREIILHREICCALKLLRIPEKTMDIVEKCASEVNLDLNTLHHVRFGTYVNEFIYEDDDYLSLVPQLVNADIGYLNENCHSLFHILDTDDDLDMCWRNFYKLCCKVFRKRRIDCDNDTYTGSLCLNKTFSTYILNSIPRTLSRIW